MKIVLTCMMITMLSIAAFAGEKSNQPIDSKPFMLRILTLNPCTATVASSEDFYVYNCNGNTYTNRISASCTKTAPTCTAATTSAQNCMTDALAAAGAAWRNQIRDANCPQETIDWID